MASVKPLSPEHLQSSEARAFLVGLTRGLMAVAEAMAADSRLQEALEAALESEFENVPAGVDPEVFMRVKKAMLIRFSGEASS